LIFAHLARRNPCIGRLTRAYPNFEVKDGAQRRRLRRSMILEFKVQIGFSAALRRMGSCGRRRPVIPGHSESVLDVRLKAGHDDWL
jgi:hypothetical protein